MSMFYVECLNCKSGETYWWPHPKKWVCPQCNSEHLQIGEIRGLHVCHGIPIWRLEGTDRVSDGGMPVMIMGPHLPKIQRIIYDEYNWFPRVLNAFKKMLGSKQE